MKIIESSQIMTVVKCHSERSEESPMAKRYAELDCHVTSLRFSQ